MSRTFARLELSVTQNGNKIKTFAEDVSTDEKDVSTLLSALQKTKESSNEFLTTLVEEEKLNKPGGVVISHSKRKHSDEGTYFVFFSVRIHDSFIMGKNRFSFNFQTMNNRSDRQPAVILMKMKFRLYKCERAFLDLSFEDKKNL